MYILRYLTLVLFLAVSLFANSFPFDLHYPNSKLSKSKIQKYDRLEVYYEKKRSSFYGQIWYENLKYPKFKDGKHFEKIKAFFVKQLGIKESDINSKGYGHFFKGEDEYYLKLDTFSTSYKYTLLKINSYPRIVSFKENVEYKYAKKSYKERFSKKPKNILIPHVKDFAIEKLDYKKYDEKSFHYDNKKHQKNGQYWNVKFKNISKDKNSYRYIISHDYKEKVLKMGAKILENKDNDFMFEYEDEESLYFVKFNTYNNTFSMEIVKEERFVQSLVSSPDKIKIELDKKGKITLDGIYFDFDKAILKKESQKAILSTVSLMEKYIDLVISIQGHTDAKGDDRYNLKLSTARAKAVKNAIVSKGIDEKRVKSKGFGESKPLASNDTDEGRAKNRRVELHKVNGGDKKAIITIDFIKPIENSVLWHKKTTQNSKKTIVFTKPYFEKKERIEYIGTYKRVQYKIMKDGKVDDSFSRKSIIKNYENILYLYNAQIIGKYSDTLYFIIKNRGDGKTVYGSIEAYNGTYYVNFLIKNKIH